MAVTVRGWPVWLAMATSAALITPAQAAPTADQIMTACLAVQGPAALRQLGIDPRIRSRADASARAEAVCRELVGHCTGAPTQEGCQRVLADLGLAPEPAQPSLGAALFDAARLGDEATLRTLLAEGAPADWHGVGGWTPLMIAAAERHADAVGRLLAAGADPNLRNAYGRTALMYAAGYGQTHIVGALLAAGADPNLQPTDATRWPALIAAAAQGHAGVVSALLAAGADPGLAARDGRRAIDLARAGGHREVVQLLEPRASPR